MSSETKEMVLIKQSFHCDFAFITTPSNTPSVPNFPSKLCGSTGPGNRKDMANLPGGQRFLVCILNAWEYLYIVASPVIVTPLINIVPSIPTSQENSAAIINPNYVSYQQWDLRPNCPNH